VRVFAYVLAAHAFAFGIGATANAADMFSMEDDACGSWKDGPCEKPALWSGAYIGIFAGGGSGNVDITDVYEYDSKDPIAKNSINSAFATAGVQIGYNVQRDNFVFGVEAGLGLMNLNGSVTDDDLRPDGSNWNEDAWGVRDDHDPISATYDFSGNLYGELTGRVGYTNGNELFYVKGGAAFVNANLDAHYSGNNYCTTHGYNSWCDNASNYSTFDFGKSDTLLGWTLGIGLEYALSNSLSLKAEYQHFDFGSISFDHNGTVQFHETTTTAISTLTGNVDADVTLDVVKVGLNYKLQD